MIIETINAWHWENLLTITGQRSALCCQRGEVFRFMSVLHYQCLITEVRTRSTRKCIPAPSNPSTIRRQSRLDRHCEITVPQTKESSCEQTMGFIGASLVVVRIMFFVASTVISGSYMRLQGGWRAAAFSMACRLASASW